MQLAIYTYGYGDAMYYMLNAIAMIMKNKGFMLIIRNIAAISVVISTLKWVASRSMGLNDRSIIFKMMALYFVINVLITPKISLPVKDRVSKKIEVIDNLPFLFMPFAWLEELGDKLAGFTEQAMRPVRDFSVFGYRNYGLAFGTQMQREAKNWRIHSPEFARNMHEFLGQCVKHKAGMGNKYNVNDLHNSPNVWELISTNTGGISRVGFLVDGKYKTMSCKAGAQLIETRYFPAEFESLTLLYAKSLFARASGAEPSAREYDKDLAQRTFAANVESAFAGFKEAHEAKKIIMQQMMLTAISHQNSISKYGLATARAHQETLWSITGDLAREYLPILFTLIKCLLYSSVVILTPMMLMPNGLRYYRSLLMTVCSMQLWPFFSSVLNMFIEIYSNISVYGLGNNILNYASYSRFGHSADIIATIAGAMQMAIPIVSYKVIADGAGAIMSFGGQVMNMSAASSSAEEVVKGRRSIGNVAVDTMQYATQTAFKTDLNRSISSGSGMYSQIDGSQERFTAGGEIFQMTGSGLNLGSYSNKIDFRGEQLFSSQQALGQELRYANSKGAQLDDVRTAQETATDSYIKQLAERVDAGEDIKFSELGRDGLAVEKAVNYELAHGSGYNYEKNQSNSLRGDVNAKLDILSTAAGIPIPGKAGKLVGKLLSKTSPLELNTSIAGSLEAGARNTQAINRNYTTSEADHWRNNKDAIAEVAKNKNFNSSAGINKELTDTITSNHEKAKNLTQEVAMHREKADHISKQIQHLESFGESFNVDGTHKVEERLMSMGLKSREAHRIIEDPISASPQERQMFNIAKGEVGRQMAKSLYNSPVVTREDISVKERGLESKYVSDSEQFVEQGQQAVTGQRLEAKRNVLKSKAGDGFNDASIMKEVVSTEYQLRDKHRTMTENAMQQANTSFNHINKKQVALKSEVQREEGKRWSKDFAGKNLPKE